MGMSQSHKTRRRPSDVVDDTEPLLAAGGDAVLYNTISVRRKLITQQLTN